ncbi:MAG TPA: hypothetical protein VGG74_34350 [Kofleriaceae bacterium]
MALKLVVALLLVARVASAQPGMDPASALRDANAAATAGDWAKVAALAAPVTTAPNAADRAEAFRLHGLAEFFASQRAIAERDFVAYLRLDPDGHLDPALYPPEAINFFNDVHARHAQELRRPPKRYAVVAALPVFAQLQNGDRTKAWVLAGAIGAFAATNIATYFVLRSWCHDSGDTCDASGRNHFVAAQHVDVVNIASGVALIATLLYGVYDGVSGYRAHSQLYVAPETNGALVGISAHF